VLYILRDSSTVEIYDINGRLIRVLPPAQGAWDGKSQNGKTVPEGLYFIRVKGKNSLIKVVKF